MNEIHDAAAAYALDALDGGEQQEFEQHLAGCAGCRREVEELRDAAADLVLSVVAPPPPPGLRAAVLAGIAGVEQLPAAPGRPRRALASVPVDETEDEVAPRPVARPADPTSEVDELALRRAGRRARLLSVLVAAVTVVALALGGVVYSLARQAEAPPVASPQLPAGPQVDPSLLAAPDARIIPTTLKNGAQASFVVSKSLDRAAFVSTDLPLPGAGNEYHLWTLKGNTVVRPDATLPGGADQVQLFTGPVDDSTALAVNIEPVGSNPQAPTTTVLGSTAI